MTMRMMMMMMLLTSCPNLVQGRRPISRVATFGDRRRNRLDYASKGGLAEAARMGAMNISNLREHQRHLIVRST